MSTASGASLMSWIGWESQSVLVTLARSKATSSESVRLVPWTTLPSMQRRSPSGLMISPQSCATVNLRALGRCLDDGDVARCGQIAQAERHRVGTDRGGKDTKF